MGCRPTREPGATNLGQHCCGVSSSSSATAMRPRVRSVGAESVSTSVRSRSCTGKAGLSTRKARSSSPRPCRYRSWLRGAGGRGHIGRRNRSCLRSGADPLASLKDLARDAQPRASTPGPPHRQDDILPDSSPCLGCQRLFQAPREPIRRVAHIDGEEGVAHALGRETGVIPRIENFIAQCWWTVAKLVGPGSQTSLHRLRYMA